MTIQPLLILAASALTIATAMAAGSLVLRLTVPRLPRSEEAALAFLAGAPVLSLTIFLLCAARAVSWQALLAVSVLAIGSRLVWSRDRREPPPPVAPLSAGQRLLLLLPLSAFGLVYFVWALAPEASPDGAGYHLGLVARYLREGGFRPAPASMYECLSQGVEMLFLHAFAFGGHSSAALVHLAFLFALAALMLGYARRTGRSDAGIAATVLVFASPVVGISASSAYNDAAAAAVLFAVFYCLHIWVEVKEFNALFLIGMLSGFCYAVKYTAFPALPFAAGWTLIRLWKSPRRFLQALTALSGAALTMISPWMVKNWITAGNPLAPFFNHWFPNPYVTISFEESYRASMSAFNGVRLDWNLPWAVTVDGGALGGLLGPVFLLAPLAFIALRWSPGRLLLLATAVFGSTYPANIGTRFLIPMIPFLALAMALVLERWKPAAVAALAVHAVLSWPFVIERYSDRHAWRINNIPWRAALRITPQEEYLNQRLQTYRSARLVEEHVPPGSEVFSISGTAGAYTTREVRMSYELAPNNVLQQVLWSPLAAHFQPTGRILFRFSPQRLRGIRVAETGSGIEDWGVNELRIFSQSKELPRAPEWRLKAHPNPWDVVQAFDNSPLTPWRAYQRVSAGMFIEVDMRRPELADSVLIECACDIHGLRLRLEGRGEGERWRVLDESPVRWHADPREAWKRVATADLKALGIDFLLIDDWDHYAEELRKNAAAWGLRPVGESGGSRLYRIE